MSMAHTTALLKEVDAHIEAHRRQIATLQVEIARLEDTRVTLMRMEERKAYFAGQPSPFGDLGGGTIALRDPELRAPEGLARLAQRSLPDGWQSHLAKTGQPPAIAASDGLQTTVTAAGGPYTLRAPGQRGRDRHTRKPRGGGDMRKRVLNVLKDVPEGMTSAEIGGYLGIPTAGEQRKPLQNALYNMRLAKLIDLRPGQFPGRGRRKDSHVYILTALGQQHLAKEAPG